MNYTEHIKRSIDFIENNLTNDISILDCAKAANYSQYHFLRIFKIVTGLTPADYIRKRRISEVAKLVFNDICISELAFRYGFNSKENFIRAFEREHGITPMEYKKANNSLNLLEPIVLASKNEEIVPEIIYLSQFDVVGCEYMTAFERNYTDIPMFWNQYNCQGISQKLTNGITCDDYGICLIEDENFKYFIGVKSKNAVKNEVNNFEMKNLTVPSATYAVFTTPEADSFNFVTQIHKTWDYIYEKWLNKSIYKESAGYVFEVYNQQSHFYREKIYIPIEKK